MLQARRLPGTTGLRVHSPWPAAYDFMLCSSYYVRIILVELDMIKHKCHNRYIDDNIQLINDILDESWVVVKKVNDETLEDETLRLNPDEWEAVPGHITDILIQSR